MRCKTETLIVILACAVNLTLLGPGATSDLARMPTLEEVKREVEAKGYSWTPGHTPISHLSVEQFTRLCGGGLPFPENYDAILREVGKAAPPCYPANLPSRFDWTDSAAVSPVRTQDCGDCWAQAAVAAVESQMLMHDRDTTLLSVQQAIDCNFMQASCAGGWHTSVFQLYTAVGAVAQTCYPYLAVDSECTEDTCDIILRLDGWQFIDTTLVSLKTHLMNDGPLAAWMQVWPDISSYTGGCYEHEPTPVNLGHLVLIVGWDDSKCGGAGAWHIKNSWGTAWGEEGYGWIKYWTGYIGALAAVPFYTPREPANLVHESHAVDDSAGDGDGKPDPGETATLQVALRNRRWQAATGGIATLSTTAPGIQILTSLATFPDIAPGAAEQSNPPHLSFAVGSLVACGTRIHFTLSMACDQGDFTDDFDILAGDAETVLFDDVEADLGWMIGVPGDDAAYGAWLRQDPKGSIASDEALVQPELDHSPGGRTTAFVTQNIKRHNPPDFRDVDGGKTTLISPVMDLTGYASTLLRYWRWYTNETGPVVDDSWVVDISADSGATWVNLESEPSGSRNWVAREFNLGERIPLSDRVLVRFVASDYGGESTVEAAVDDFEITGCPWWVDANPPAVEVAFPNGGERLVAGDEAVVRWHAQDDYGMRGFTVVASYDSGVSFTDTIGLAGGFDTALVWDLPTDGHHRCKIGVAAADRGYNLAFDASDSTFSIVPEDAGVDQAVAEHLPPEVRLGVSGSNPSAGVARVSFALPREMQVGLAAYDTRGRLVAHLRNGSCGAGYHSASWDGRTVSGARAVPGVYFIRLETPEGAWTAKVVLAH